MDINITKLKNNIRVVSHEMQNLETLSLGVWIEVGARDEKQNEQGISHLLEHMAFKGTKTRSAKEIAMAIENVGGDINASTSLERTSYYVRVMKNDAKVALEILSDIIKNSIFDQSELDKEKNVIYQEIASNNDSPDDVVFENLQKTAYSNQSIGRSILGTNDTLSGIDSSALVSYLNRYYHSNNIVIAATGSIKHSDFVSLVEDYFSDIKKQNLINTVPARYDGGDIREEREIEQAHLLFAFEGNSYNDKNLYASHLFSNALGGGMSSRLFQNIREELGLSYSVFSFASNYKDTGIFGIYAATSPEKINECSRVIAEELFNITSTLTEEELERAKKQLKSGLMMALESPISRLNQIARQVSIYGRVFPTNEIIQKIDQQSIESIQAYSRNMIDSSMLTVSALGPISKLHDYNKLNQYFTQG
ncbi:MAG: M16 family metallopeptidase [Alphaproteobacteria bacterium]|jgi:predicted Zn-dependent peptidase|tara:strand:- start:3886 stop:5151 length:1266 start_codon:yes stop_codon:yes gene_type:complete